MLYTRKLLKGVEPVDVVPYCSKVLKLDIFYRSLYLGGFSSASIGAMSAPGSTGKFTIYAGNSFSVP